jgi:hypothetical protein
MERVSSVYIERAGKRGKERERKRENEREYM